MKLEELEILGRIVNAPTGDGPRTLLVRRGRYGNGNVAIVLQRECDGSPEHKLSYNAGELPPGLFTVTDYTPPELAAACLASGLFVDTGELRDGLAVWILVDMKGN